MDLVHFMKTGRTRLHEGDMELQNIETERIVANPRQPRRHFDSGALEELASSIRSVGILQPLLVRERDDGYELVAGERRLRAARMAGFERVPATVIPASDSDQQLFALVENIQRRDLSSIEEARCFRELLDSTGITQSALARRLGRSQAAIANKLRLLQLDGAVQTLVEQGRLGERHARTLLGLDAEQQRRLAEEAADRGLSTNALDKRVRSLKERDHAPSPEEQAAPHVETHREEDPAVPQGGGEGEFLQELVRFIETKQGSGMPIRWQVRELDQTHLVVELNVQLRKAPPETPPAENGGEAPSEEKEE